MNDPLGLLPELGAFAAEHLVERLREGGDEVSAQILDAQVAWLRTADPAQLAEVARLTGPLLDPKTQQRRLPRVGLAGAFGENVSSLGHEMWLYDDDLVSLVDGGLYDPKRHATPWDANDGVIELLEDAVQSGRYPVAVRLLVFEGTARLHRALRRLGLARVVTHLELRLPPEGEEPPIAERFENLRGLAVHASRLRGALGAPLPELRSLVVFGDVDPDSLWRATRRAPKLAHLAIRYARWSEAFLHALLPRIEPLKTLQLFDVNRARQLPFAELASMRSSWSHLSLLALPGHLVSEGEHARFADDPQVMFVGHDRRELVALDLATHGWPAGAR